MTISGSLENDHNHMEDQNVQQLEFRMDRRTRKAARSAAPSSAEPVAPPGKDEERV
jgi:hypothetical protein